MTVTLNKLISNLPYAACSIGKSIYDNTIGCLYARMFGVNVSTLFPEPLEELEVDLRILPPKELALFGTLPLSPEELDANMQASASYFAARTIDTLSTFPEKPCNFPEKPCKSTLEINGDQIEEELDEETCTLCITISNLFEQIKECFKSFLGL